MESKQRVNKERSLQLTLFFSFLSANMLSENLTKKFLEKVTDEELTYLLKNSGYNVRWEVVQELAGRKSEVATAALLEVLKDESYCISEAALEALKDNCLPKVTTAIIEASQKSKNFNFLKKAVEVLRPRLKAYGTQFLLELFAQSKGAMDLRRLVLEVLTQEKPIQAILPALFEAISNRDDTYVTILAVKALGQIPGQEVGHALPKLIETELAQAEPSCAVIRETIENLQRNFGYVVVGALIKVLESEKPHVNDLHTHGLAFKTLAEKLDVDLTQDIYNRHTNESVRSACVLALTNAIKNQPTATLLALARGKHEGVCRAAIKALSSLPSSTIDEMLSLAVFDRCQEIVEEAVDALAERFNDVADNALVSRFKKTLDGNYHELAYRVFNILTKTRRSRVVNMALADELLNPETMYGRFEIVNAFSSHLPDQIVERALIKAAAIYRVKLRYEDDKDNALGIHVAGALKPMLEHYPNRLLIRLLKQGNDQLRIFVVEAMAKRRSAAITRSLAEFLRKPKMEPKVREAIAQVLESRPTKAAQQALLVAAADKVSGVCVAASYALVPMVSKWSTPRLIAVLAQERYAGGLHAKAIEALSTRVGRQIDSALLAFLHSHYDSTSHDLANKVLEERMKSWSVKRLLKLVGDVGGHRLCETAARVLKKRGLIKKLKV